MGLLIVSILVAIACALSAYVATASLVVAFIAYAASGTMTLVSALIAEGLTHAKIRRHDEGPINSKYANLNGAGYDDR